MPTGQCACATSGCPAGSHLISWGYGPAGCVGAAACCRFHCSDGNTYQCNPPGPVTPAPAGSSNELLPLGLLLGGMGLLVWYAAQRRPAAAQPRP